MVKKNSPLKLVLSNSYGTANVGDQAILTSMIELLRKCLGEVEIDVLSRWPQKTSQRHPNVNAVHSEIFRGFFATCRSIKNADLLIFGGGGIIQDVSSFGNLIFHLSRLVLARLFGSPFVGCGLGVGPINSKFGRRLTSIVLNWAEGLYVRDESSAELLRSINITKPLIVVTSDFVFALDFAEDAKKEQPYQQVLKLKQQSSCLIGVCLRPEAGKHKQLYRQSSGFMKMLKNVAKVCDELIEKRDARIVFISMEPVEDQAIAEQFLPLMQHKDKVMILPSTLKPKVVMAVSGLLDVMIGMRLHSLIFAARSVVPFVALGYDPKVAGFCKSLGLQKQVVPVCDVEPAELLELVEESLHKCNEISQSIKERMPKLEVCAKQNIKAVMELAASR